MATLKTKRTFNSQTLMWDEITWKYLNIPASVSETTFTPVSGLPTGFGSGVPYWEFEWQLTTQGGLSFRKIVARNTYTSGSTEPVFQNIDFTDLKVAFNDISGNDLLDFNISEAFNHPESKFKKGINGSRFTVDPNDQLFQYGFYLLLVNDFGGTCKVKLEIAVVFRGAANDFDPGGMTWALEVFPQIAWSFEFKPPSPRRPRWFRGSVRTTINNYLKYGTHAAMATEANAPSFWTDSNAAFTNSKRADMLSDTSIGSTRSYPAYWSGKPFGWGMLFDYNLIDLQTEVEFPAVFWVGDGATYMINRTRVYDWPKGKDSSGTDVSYPDGFELIKYARQGYYDNMHIHAKMPHNDSKGNIPVHAPFCGHSCIHQHWRWSAVAANSAADDRGWQFKGWSLSEGHKVTSAPLIPQNQKLTVALTKPTRIRDSQSQILPLANVDTLDALSKTIWYCADIFHLDIATPLLRMNLKINQGEKHVIMEHGIGWAYRYSTPKESTAMDGLTDAISDNLPWLGTPTQDQLADFFDHDVYPLWRYFDDLGIVVNQVPEGTHSEVKSGTPVSMAKL